MDTLYSMLTLALIYATPIIIAGLGGLFSERSGIVNIALEGLMMFGAFAGAAITVALEPSFSGGINWAPWIGLIVGMIVGALFSLIHAYLSINLNADQVISGTGINLLAVGLTVFFAQIFFGQQRTDAFETGFIKTTFPRLSQIPVIGDIFFKNIYIAVFLVFILVALTSFVVYKTSFGLRLRSTGENPHASDSMGINVSKMRYIGVLLSGAFAGLAGAIMVLTQDNQFSASSIHGTGFIALAALIFGRWKPVGLLFAGLFFGFSQILGLYSTDISFLASLPGEFFQAIPYFLTVVALVIFKSSDAGPKAAGEPYDKGKR